MTKWWNNAYPFRRQLSLFVGELGITAPQRAFIPIPRKWEDDGTIVDGNPYNFAIVYQHQQIAKPVYHDMADYGGLISFQIMDDVPPNTLSDSYWLYYGVELEDAVDTPVPVYIPASIYDEHVSYSGPDHWVVTPGEIPTPWNDYLTYTPGARVSISTPASYVGLWIKSGPSSAAFRIKLDEDDWITVNPQNDTYGGWAVGSFRPSYGNKVRSITVEHLGPSDGSGTDSEIDLETIVETLLDPTNSGILTDKMFIVYVENLTGSLSELTEPAFAENGDYLLVTSAGYVPPGTFEYGPEEVNPNLPWNSTMGGTVNVIQ
jgi:hypothetical protein